jgi:hypothetical protein
MAGGITFQPQVFIKSGNLGASTPPTGRNIFAVPNRSGPNTTVGESGFKFPPSSGLGNFRKTLSKYTTQPDNFILRAEKETPFAISQRTYEISLPRGGKIDEFV